MDSFFSLVPALPSAQVLRSALPLMWAVVLACLGLRGVQILSRRGGPHLPPQTLKALSRWAAWGVAVWTTFSGLFSLNLLSPSYWLGLAFQLPSWTTVLLCAASMLRSPQPHNRRFDDPVSLWLALAGMALGWLLLLDTFALGLARGLYRQGFGAPAVLVLALVAAVILFGAVRGQTAAGPTASPMPGPTRWMGWVGRSGGVGMAVALVALSLHVFTRLPTGNVFDALLDPWLWLWLHINLARHLMAARRSPAIRG